MKLLLDENVAISLKKELMNCGLEDIIHINDIRQGMKDQEVFEFAKNENRLIISGDNHFKKNEYKYNCGVIFLTPKSKILEDLSVRIKWIIDNISNYNINIFSASISLTYQEYNIFYQKGMEKKVKNKVIPYSKIKFDNLNIIKK